MTLRGLRRASTWGVSAVVAGLFLAAAFALLHASPAGADPAPGSITIVQNAPPHDGQDFEFEGCLGSACSDFTLDDDSDPAHPSSVTGEGLVPGTYRITQQAGSWPLTGLTCPGALVYWDERTVMITVYPNDFHVTCTFTNQAQAISITQGIYSGQDPLDFEYTGCGAGGCSTFLLDKHVDPTLPETITSTGVAPGTYTVTQRVDPYARLRSISCTGETIDLEARRVTIQLSPGEIVNCTFTNSVQSISITQDSTGSHPQDFEFTGCNDHGCSTFLLDDDDDPTLPDRLYVPSVAEGTYTITQAPRSEWPLATMSCSSSSEVDLAHRTVTFTLGENDRFVCVFRNEFRPQSITVIQDHVPDDAADATFRGCLGSGCSEFVLDDDADPDHDREVSASGLGLGVYTITQDEVPDRELASISCTTDEVTDVFARRATIALEPGEQVVCTFVDRPPPTHLGGASAVSAPSTHACAVVAGGEARCWGSGDEGQLGTGSTSDRSTPVAVVDAGGTGVLVDVAEIATGAGHTCARLTGGEARCWGRQGLNGDGTTTARMLPVAVLDTTGSSPLTGVAQISSTSDHTCAALLSGEARCWGENQHGGLGNGSTTDRTRPVAVSNPAGNGPLTDVAQISAGDRVTCAVLTTGQARCWGRGGVGQVGDGTTSQRLRPVVVTNESGTGPLTDVVAISVGQSHTCARLADGQARCWGNNADGQLGDGTTTHRARPVVVTDEGGTGPLSGVIQISAGDDLTCALLQSGEARCWGKNGEGQLGDGTITSRARPVPPLPHDASEPLQEVVEIAAGTSSSCARVLSGELRCWGSNVDGAVGDGTTHRQTRAVPVIDPGAATVPPLLDVEEVSAGGIHSCARVVGGQARCWGSNPRGALGNGTSSTSLVPQVVSATDGSGALTGVAQISAGADRTCATLETGEARCWGANPYGEVGDGTTGTDRSRPVAVTSVSGTGNLDDVEQVSVGGSHTCARLTDGQARCWGQAAALGDGAGANSARPVVVSDPSGSGPLTDIVQLTSGAFHSCAVLDDGQVRCWGANVAGALGDGTTTTAARPTIVSDPDGTGPLTGVAQVSAGHTSTCAVLSNGQARCWGENGWGQLGDDTTTDRLRPVVVTDESGTGPLTGVAEVSVGYDQTCARLIDGQVRCWGGRPAVVLDTAGTAPLDDVVDLSTSSTGRHVCATLANGQARCWGQNGWGQIGDGTLVTRDRPTIVVDP